MPNPASEALRAEHAELLPEIEALRITADAVGSVPADALRAQLDARLAFLLHHLLPHARAEDAVLYPRVAELLGAPGATATMRRDHAEIARFIDDLIAARRQLDETANPAEEARRLRRLLYGLHALLRCHLAKEEELYLPLIDEGLASEDGAALIAQMEAAAQAARRSSPAG